MEAHAEVMIKLPDANRSPPWRMSNLFKDTMFSAPLNYCISSLDKEIDVRLANFGRIIKSFVARRCVLGYKEYKYGNMKERNFKN